MMLPYPGIAQFNKLYSHLMEWSSKERKTLGHMIVPVFAATHLYCLVSQRIPFTDALLCVTYFVYCHCRKQNWNTTKATIEYMGQNRQKFHCHKEVLSRFCSSKTTKNISKAMRLQLTLGKQEQRDSDPAWNKPSGTAKHYHDDEHILQHMSES